MPDRLEKFLAKLHGRELLLVQNLMLRIKLGELDGLQIKPLKGHKNFYRLRKGRVRIIFEIRSDREPEIHSVGYRDDQTYRDF